GPAKARGWHADGAGSTAQSSAVHGGEGRHGAGGHWRRLRTFGRCRIDPPTFQHALRNQESRPSNVHFGVGSAGRCWCLGELSSRAPCVEDRSDAGIAPRVVEWVAKSLRTHDEAPSRAGSRSREIRAHLDLETKEQ